MISGNYEFRSAGTIDCCRFSEMLGGKKKRFHPIMLFVLAQTETVAVIQSSCDISVRVTYTAESRYRFRVHARCCDAVQWLAWRERCANNG